MTTLDQFNRVGLQDIAGVLRAPVSHYWFPCTPKSRWGWKPYADQAQDFPPLPLFLPVDL